ncbi:MAG: redoxin domain-containing protein [Akkermansia sp.]|nr:redoxin domain-containing protein [Akkermansia sp.]
MSLRSFLCMLWLLLFGCLLTLSPVQAQDEFDDEEASETVKSKKKKKKSKKDKKNKKSKKDAEGDAETEDVDADEEKAAPAKPSVPKVVEALGKFKVFNAKPNLKAEYYIYLYSASWCGYCQQCMPVAEAQYKKMKGTRKVELIVICGDKTEAEGKNYLKSKKLKSPAIMFAELQATQFQGLPGCGMPGYPAISVVDKEGNMIKNVVGATAVTEVLNSWRELTIGGRK